MSTQYLEDTQTQERSVADLTEPGDHERLSHYVERNALMQAMLEGVAIEALCGKVWLPTRDGLKFPVCPECKEIFEGLPPGDQP